MAIIKKLAQSMKHQYTLYVKNLIRLSSIL